MAEKIPKPIRKWACHKLECFADYIAAYAKKPANTQRYYLELYTGCGLCICEGTDCSIDDAALRASRTGFARHIFVVKDHDCAESLKRLATPCDTNNMEIIIGNCNRKRVIRQVLDLVPRTASSFVFLDPPGYRWLHWATIEQLAIHSTDWEGKKMELLVVFPLEMALLRNLTRPECQTSITRLFGNKRWQEIKRQRLAGEITVDEVRDRLVALYKEGLKGLGYRYVDDFKPAFPFRQPFYHLIFSSDRNSGIKVLKDTWGKMRYLPCELLYTKEPYRE